MGQFFTTNADYILQGFERYVAGKDVTDPFAGGSDLLLWSQNHGAKTVRGFDCDKRYVDDRIIFKNDSINSPGSYKFVCTNPPYLHKNKADKLTKKLFFNGDHSVFEDLYQVSIFSMLGAEEGIVIIPLNFLCADNSRKIRNLFFEKFKIVKLNIFTEQVFHDTTYNVISFYFRRCKKTADVYTIPALVLPEHREISLTIEKRLGWKLGGEFLARVNGTNSKGVMRLTQDMIHEGPHQVLLSVQDLKQAAMCWVDSSTKKMLKQNILLLRAIDSKNSHKIRLEDIRQYGVDGLVGKSTSRNMAHIIFKEPLSINEQLELIDKFNSMLNKHRERYFSFFLTNYRDNNRKRISFDFTYKFINYLISSQRTLEGVMR